MGSLRCTLCCGETFGSVEELSDHIKTVLDNIFCTRCCEQFFSLHDLLEHYILHDCEVKTSVSHVACFNDGDPRHLSVSATQVSTNVMDNVANEAQVEAIQIKTYPTVSYESEISTAEVLSSMMERKGSHEAEISECAEVSCIPENLIFNDEEKEIEKSSVEGDMFECSCGMKFTSINEHLMNYHFDEEVVVKGSTVQLDNLLNPSSDTVEDDSNNNTTQVFPTKGSEELEESKVTPKLEEPEVIVCDRDNLLSKIDVSKQVTTTTLTPVQIDQLEGKVEECVDKDGRLYLRKFVRVEKFWSEKDELKAAQMHSKIKNFEPVRDVPVGSVSITSKDETVPDKLNGSPKKLYQCSKCTKTFQTMMHFRYHVCTLKNSPAISCNLCDHESATSKEWRAHWRMHQRQRRVAATALWELQGTKRIEASGNDESEETEELQCERCGEMYKKSEELVHIAMHDEGPPYECKKCDAIFDSKVGLTRHMRSHREQKTHICLYCGKSFTDANAYKLHVRSHTGEKPFECTYCGKTFSRPYERMKHERIHTGERPHVCEICGKTFRVSYCLTLHKRTHSGDRPYCCDTCGKRFKAHSAYKHHVQIHSEERNYKCPYCPKAFKTMVHLAGHKKTHTKPFSCKECNRRFASLYSVKAHMESHKTGDNRFRYRCFVCGASYARAFALQYHMQTHEPYEAPEDVAEVLEVCVEDNKKKDSNLSDSNEIQMDKKTEIILSEESEASVKLEDPNY